ncbi:MAG: glycosyltransferase [Deltaproteobacteria bacterium]|nr:glycosyltransferase [Deltaproteobacteria bacterium]
MEKTPKISIGLPVYNAERYLRHSIESILGQTFSNFELVISDNASTDSTFDICAEYAARDRRIRLHRNARNLGAADNFNRVFRLSRAEYFKWAAYDDVCSPLLLERCLELLEDEPRVALCYPKTVLIDENGEEIGKYDDSIHIPYARHHERLRNYLTKVNLANAVFGLMRSSVLRETKLLGKYFGADYVLLMEVLLRGRFHELPEHLFMRRDHANPRRLPERDSGMVGLVAEKHLQVHPEQARHGTVPGDKPGQSRVVRKGSASRRYRGGSSGKPRWRGRYKATLKQRLQLPGAQTER